jgi:hypothetical protein
MTRVDVLSAARRGGWDAGRNARRIARFLHELRRRIGAREPSNR